MALQTGNYSPTFGGDRLMTSGKNKVVIVGDSITELQVQVKTLLTLLGSPSWELMNHGISAHTTTMLIARIAGTLQDTKINTIILLAGIVDIITGVASAVTIANLQTLYTTIKAANVKLIAITLLPFKNYAPWNAAMQVKLDAINVWIMGYANSTANKTLDLYPLMEDPGNPDCLLPAYDSGDGLHPNVAGMTFMQNYEFNNISWKL